MTLFTKLLVIVLLIAFMGQVKAGEALNVTFDNYDPDRPYVILIPGAGSNGGKLYVKSLTEILHLTGHEDYFEGYYKILDDIDVPFTLCPQTQDKDSRLLTTRAAECVTHIWNEMRKSRKLPRKNIFILGHSMGGNIARLVAADPLLGNYIDSVLTISTPNKGTAMADFVFEHYDKRWLNAFYKSVMELIGFTPGSKKYIKELTTQRKSNVPALYMAQDVRKHPRVKYYSISNSKKRNFTMPPLEVTRVLLKKQIEKLGLDNTKFGAANDGLIPAYAMVHGEHVGHVKADHFEGVCIGILEGTKGCKRMKKLLVPFLKNKVDELRMKLLTE